VDISSEQFNAKLNDLKLHKYVSYLGKKYNDEKYEIFQSSDIFVFPTFYHNETTPIVVLEAMMWGIPVISTSEGAISDMITNNETGFIVEKENAEELANKIKFLIENPKICKQMGERGNLNFHKYYKVEVFEKTLLNILNQ
jgi:glycosyltransferase involved in cell wall biosynthesis